MILYNRIKERIYLDFNLVPRALFPGFGGGAGKGPGIGRSHDHQTPSICGCNKLAFKLAYDRIYDKLGG